MIFGYAKMAITLVMIIGIGGALTYVFKLRADNAVLKANNMVLEKSVESQQQVIAQQKEDFKTILETNQKLTTLSNNLQYIKFLKLPPERLILLLHNQFSLKDFF